MQSFLGFIGSILAAVGVTYALVRKIMGDRAQIARLEAERDLKENVIELEVKKRETEDVIKKFEELDSEFNGSTDDNSGNS